MKPIQNVGNLNGSNAREGHRNHRNDENGLEPAQGNVMKISVLETQGGTQTKLGE